ncbi:MAG: hypothetical protein KatS3mg088_177 [Patescibacteria group bacterium]|nr:MAG: hypothetical protein KatS3mg088_177 [Patescibacteria group bacterium]
MKFFNKNKKIIFILLAAFVFRLLISFFGTLDIDFNTFLGWSYRLVKHPLPDFYKEWSDYLPGYLYILFILGKIKNTFGFVPNEILYKFPAIIADIVSTFLVYKIVFRLKGQKTALMSALFYAFNPAIFANSSLWGQVDSLTILFSLLSLYFFDSSFTLSAIFLAFGTAVKIQASLTVIPILFLFWTRKINIKTLFNYGLIALSFFLLTFLPFLPFGKDLNQFPLFVWERVGQTLNQYPYTSVNAFNFWGLFGFWQPDQKVFTSIFSFLILFSLSIFSFLRLKKVKGAQYLILTLVFFVSFLFFPRMHERHLLPVFAPLLISASLFTDLLVVYIFLSILYCLNLYYSFIWITDNFKVVFSDFFIKILIFFEILTFSLLLNVGWSGKTRLIYFFKDKLYSLFHSANKPSAKLFSNAGLPRERARIFLILILMFAFICRVYRLGIPEKEYFDEVYHAFTARLMLHGDPKAWEWWNPHPEGYAYEWSHPPLAKIGMQIGMIIFGENSFGWRFPAALLGTLSVLLVYLIGKEVFKDEIAALFSALFFSLDGLFLVLSRIGMNDSYLLFFSLLTIYLFLKDKILLSSLSFGLALSSKWSAVWVVPILFTAFFAFGKKLKFDYIWFLILPPLVYIASYTQMFLTGHSFDIFVGVQKQMWWYHTGLKATHPYTSPWWSWPLLIRPIWLYTNSFGSGMIANIYAFGNPAIFWFGLASIFITLYYAYLFKNKRLGWLVFSYLVFFVPWSLSPRIMFLYHYLPSIPFLSCAIGFVLRKNIRLFLPYLVTAFVLFVYFYPHLIGLPINIAIDNSFYWFSSWR